MSFGSKDRVFHTQFMLRVFQTLCVGFRVGEMERIAGCEFAVEFRPGFVIEQEFEPLARTQTEMVVALRANFPVCLQVFFPDDGAAGAALCPHAFGAHTTFLHRSGVLDRFFLAFEPGHG